MNLRYLASTEQGSSWSSIFLENSIDALGIHKKSNEEKKRKLCRFYLSCNRHNKKWY